MTSPDLSIVILLAVCMVESALALSCPCWWHKPSETQPLTYAELYCDLDLQCPPGSQEIPDHCGCCSVCSHIEDEECGGPWNVLGQCSAGLECIDPNTGGPVQRLHGNIRTGKCMPPGAKVAPPTHAPWCPWCADTTPKATPSPIEDGLTTPSEIDPALNAVGGDDWEKASKPTRRPRKPKKNTDRKDKKESRQERKERKERERKERKERKLKMRKQRKIQKNDVSNEILPL